MASKAYLNGFADGLAWDLDGYETEEAVRADREGWDEATINAVGAKECALAWGVAWDEELREVSDPDAWDEACTEYNRGAHDGACHPERRGLPPGWRREE